MYHPTSRVLTVLELLQSHRRISGPDLAARLEVDVRTVRRYITMLQDMGIPVEAETGRYGGYALRPGFKLPPLMFTDDEATALTLGMLIAQRMGMTTTAPAIEGVLAKVQRVLPDAVRQRVQALQETLVVDLRPADTLVDSAIIGTLSLAVQQSQRVQLCYAGGGEETERVIDPYGVVCHGGRWYTVGYCHLRAGMRVFRLDRMRCAELCAAHFTPLADFDSLRYITESFAAIPDIWNVEVLLTTTLDTARRMLPPSLALLEQRHDGVLLRASIDDLDMLARELVRLACPMTIHRPPELRAVFQRLADEVAGIGSLSG
jgi:predicted DNA-binding transcriptional regulator YafY